jgi:DNA-binding IclR family transcriptional regulator
MNDGPELDLDADTRDVFDLLRRQPGDAFTVGALAEQLDFAPEEIRASLQTLERLGLVNRAGVDRFIISPSAPNL